MSDETVIVCAPWSEEQLMALPGNRTDACGFCSDPVVISPQGRRMREAETRPVILACLRCARREAPDEVVMEVPGAIEAAEAAGVSAKWSELFSGQRMRDVLDEDGRFRR